MLAVSSQPGNRSKKKSWSYTALKCHGVPRTDKPTASLRHTASLLAPRWHPQELHAQLSVSCGDTDLGVPKPCCHKTGLEALRTGAGRVQGAGLGSGDWQQSSKRRRFAMRGSELLREPNYSTDCSKEHRAERPGSVCSLRGDSPV